MNKEIDNLINKPIKDDLSNWNITDIQLIKSYLVDFQHQLEEKEKVIDETIKYLKKHSRMISTFTGIEQPYAQENLSTDEVDELLEILERGKNG